MPTYQYRCAQCGHELEVFQPITDSPKRKCPACGKQRLQRVISAGAGILFRGSGFYQTDYRSESYKKGAEAENPAPAAEPKPPPKPSEKPSDKPPAKSNDKPGRKKKDD